MKSTKIMNAAEQSLHERISKGPPLPGPGSTYEQGFVAGAQWFSIYLAEIMEDDANQTKESDVALLLRTIAGQIKSLAYET